LIRRSRQIDR